MNSQRHFGKVLANERHKLGLSQDALAKKVKCHKQQISNFETGLAPVPLKLARNYATALEFPMARFLKQLEELELKRFWERANALYAPKGKSK